jgi:acetyltransferase-like isoleucine patch superfamily enzyme
MSWFSNYWRQRKAKSRDKRLRKSIDPRHGLRRHLAYFVSAHGFEVGDYSYGSPNIRMMWSDAQLVVGKYCSIADGVQFILGGNHPLDHATTFPLSKMSGRTTASEGPFSRGDIVIGADVWIGKDATILSGVTIADGAIVGACAVVASDVAPYSIVAGNPARLIRRRFSEEIIAQMIRLRWWDLPDEDVSALQARLQSSDVDGLISAIRRIRDADGTALDH